MINGVFVQCPPLRAGEVATTWHVGGGGGGRWGQERAIGAGAGKRGYYIIILHLYHNSGIGNIIIIIL